MFNLGSGEIALIAVAALLILGPKRLPELARGLGRFMREFRRQTDEVRGVVEREFYRMDEPPPRTPEFEVRQPPDAVAIGHHDEPLPLPPDDASQVTKGMRPGEPVSPPAPPAEPPTKS
jgi:sec-independent protein translocase protein TatB